MMIWVAAFLVGAGTTVASLSVLELAARLWVRLRLLFRPKLEREWIRYTSPEADALPEHLLYGLPRLPWRWLGIGLAAVGFLIVLVLAGIRYAPMAVVLERVPWLIQRVLRGEGKRRLRLQVRDFVDDLRESLAIHGSLGRALISLAEIAKREGGKGPVPARLLRHARSLSVNAPADQILEQIADDLKSEDMRRVARQVRLALSAGMDLQEALEIVATNLTESIATEVNVRLQSAANVYVLPMVIFTFGPLMALGLYPVVLRIVALLSGG